MIQAEHLSKFFGSRLAVDDLSFEIAPGAVVGFLGLNGAGKTTTLRMLSGDLAPSSGTVRIQGRDLAREPRTVKRRIGFLPDSPPVYPEMSVRAYLRFVGALHGLRGRDLGTRIDEVAETVSIREVVDDLVGSLSHGYRQRLGIAQAIVHGPEFVILDEPISGLDPVQIAEMRLLIRALAGTHTVLLSSHILTEISQTCDRILVMGDGGILADGTEDELRAKLAADALVRATVRGNVQVLTKELEVIAGVRSVEVEPGLADDEHVFVIRAEGDVREPVASTVIGAGFGLRGLERTRPALESLFVELTSAGYEAAAPVPGPEPEPQPEENA